MSVERSLIRILDCLRQVVDQRHEIEDELKALGFGSFDCARIVKTALLTDPIDVSMQQTYETEVARQMFGSMSRTRPSGESVVYGYRSHWLREEEDRFPRVPGEPPAISPLQRATNKLIERGERKAVTTLMQRAVSAAHQSILRESETLLVPVVPRTHRALSAYVAERLTELGCDRIHPLDAQRLGDIHHDGTVKIAFGWANKWPTSNSRIGFPVTVDLGLHFLFIEDGIPQSTTKGLSTLIPGMNYYAACFFEEFLDVSVAAYLALASCMIPRMRQLLAAR